MKFCDQCGNALKDSAKFCPTCGSSVEDNGQLAQRVCPQCSAPMDDSALFCEACGARSNSEELRAIPPQRPIAQSHTSATASANYENTLQYLSIAASLEKSLYTQDTTIAEVKSYIDSLGHYTCFQAPQRPDRASLDLEDIKGAGGLACLGAMVCFFIGIFAGWSWSHVITVAVVIFIGWLLFGSIVMASENRRNAKQYATELALYDQAVDKDKKRVLSEREEAKKLSATLRQMQDKRDETDTVRSQFYAEDVVFPKYRNLITVCTFYEYFLSQRCFQLTGPGGAYNTYENEMRLDMICTKLDDVIKNLEQIKANQFYLYEAIQEGNQICQRILKESIHQSKLLNQTAENTALTAHYAEIAANNAEACAWIGVANYLSIEDGKKRLNS